jgi:hypothetical protein
MQPDGIGLCRRNKYAPVAERIINPIKIAGFVFRMSLHIKNQIEPDSK